MKLVAFSVVFALLLSGCFEKPVEKVLNRHANGEKKTSLWVYADGTVKKRNEWFSNGIKEFEVPYKNGVENGAYVRWSVHGDVIGKGHYKDGVLDGVQELFFTDSRLRGVQFYKNGLREGRFEEFYFNGNKKSEEHYENDTPIGEFQYFRADGTLYIKNSCHKNAEQGYFIEFLENGRKKSEYVCKFGVKTGRKSDYYLGGALAETSEFENGILHGERRKYLANGTLIRLEFYKHGVRDSVWLAFDSFGDTLKIMPFQNGSGEVFGFCTDKERTVCADTVFVKNEILRVSYIAKGLRYEESFENGKKVISRAYYIDNDNLASEAFYKEGSLHGIFRNWHKNGALQDSLYYINGERFGEQFSFDKSGRIVRHTKENGKKGQVIYLLKPSIK